MTAVVTCCSICEYTSTQAGLQAGSQGEKKKKERKENNKVNWSDVAEEEADRKQRSRISAGHDQQSGRERLENCCASESKKTF